VNLLLPDCLAHYTYKHTHTYKRLYLSIPEVNAGSKIMLDDSGALASVDAVGVNWGRRRDNAERQLRSNNLGIESKSS